MASQIPPGQNLTASKAPNIIAMVIVLWLASSTFVGLRLWARNVSKVALGLDDWLSVFAMILFTATCIANSFGVKYGAGKHIIAVVTEHPSYIEKFLQYIYTAEVLYPFVISPIKCSICCLYVRLFRVHRGFRWYCRALITITIMWATGLLLGSIFQCTPVKRAWDPTGNRANCVNLRNFLVGTNVPNIIIDFLILIAPIYPIWKLHLPMKKKILIVAILMLGAGEVAFSIVRLAKLVNLSTTDATWDYFDAIVWSTVEQSVGIICVCLPVMGPLLPHAFIGSNSDSEIVNHSGGSHALKAMDRKTFNQLGNDSSAEHDVERNNIRGNNIRRTTEVRVDYQSKQ